MNLGTSGAHGNGLLYAGWNQDQGESDKLKLSQCNPTKYTSEILVIEKKLPQNLAESQTIYTH